MWFLWSRARYVTDIWDTSPRNAPADSPYRRWSENVFGADDAHVAAKGGDPLVVAEKIANLLEARRPRFRNTVGRLARYSASRGERFRVVGFAGELKLTSAYGAFAYNRRAPAAELPGVGIEHERPR